MKLEYILKNIIHHAATLDTCYPVGSIYMTVNNVNPANIFGGTWEQIKDKFLLSAGNTYAAGTTGGEATHTLTTNELPYLGKFSAVSWASGNGATNGIFSKQFMYKDITAPSGSAAGTAEFTAQGGKQAHNNMPPYLTVYVWKRTA